MSKISAVINTLNAAKTLGQCLQSLQFADEIVVVDMQSEDDTVAIARNHGARVEQISRVAYVEEVRNQTIGFAQYPWVILLDADEALSEAAAKRCREIANENHSEMAEAYLLPRKNIVFGAWVKHTGWWPDWQVRFFRKQKVKWSGKIHEPPQVRGSTGSFPAKESYSIMHSNYDSIDQFLQRLDRYTTVEANQHPLSQSPSANQLITTLFDEFFRRYYLHQGWKDGLHGASLSLLQSFYQIITLLKQWEQLGFNENRQIVTDRVIESIWRDWRYWRAVYRTDHSQGITKFFWNIRKFLRW